MRKSGKREHITKLGAYHLIHARTHHDYIFISHIFFLLLCVRFCRLRDKTKECLDFSAHTTSRFARIFADDRLMRICVDDGKEYEWAVRMAVF